LQTTIGYAKLDVDSDGVWSALDKALQTGALKAVQQLGLMVHLTSGLQQRHQATHQWNTLIRLERAGFRRWLSVPGSTSAVDASRRDRHQQPTNIYQLVYLNIRFIV